jgi:pyruvate kinase
MLSAESAAGKYPIESVTMQQLIINKVETDEVFRTSLDRFAEEIDHQPGSKHSITSAITIAARQVGNVYQYVSLRWTCCGAVITRGWTGPLALWCQCPRKLIESH